MIYPDDYINKVICGDCLKIMKDISDKSVDLVLTDPPYRITDCKWDILPQFEKLWLRKYNYPKGFQVLCHNCNMAKRFGVCPHKEKKVGIK